MGLTAPRGAAARRQKEVQLIHHWSVFPPIRAFPVEVMFVFYYQLVIDNRAALGGPLTELSWLKIGIFFCKHLHNTLKFAPYVIDSSCRPLAPLVHLYQQTLKACNLWGFSTSGCALGPLQLEKAMTDSMDVTMVKKFTYFIVGLFVILISGSTFSGALEFHDVISSGIQRADRFPESAWLIALGALLISGAAFLRRRRAARSR
jgi:hypothetical protein